MTSSAWFGISAPGSRVSVESQEVMISNYLGDICFAFVGILVVKPVVLGTVASFTVFFAGGDKQFADWFARIGPGDPFGLIQSF